MADASDAMGALLHVLESLRVAEARFHLRYVRRDTITVLVDTPPGEIWEIDVARDGTVTVERFDSSDVTRHEHRRHRLADVVAAASRLT